MTAIDCHCHIYPEPYLAVINELRGGDAPYQQVAGRFGVHPSLTQPLKVGQIEQRLELMDDADIATHVLSLAPPYVWAPDVEVRVRLAASFNSGVSDLHRQHPSRFRFFATMPLPFVEASVDETRRAMELPGFAGVAVGTHTETVPIDDERWLPLYEVWNQHHLTVFLHPDGLCVPGVLNQYGLDLALGAPFDDTIAAARLIHSGIQTRFPDIRWLVPHLGGALPFLLGRLDLMWQRFRATVDLSAAPPSESLNQLYFDTVAAGATELQIAKAQLGVSRLVLGSDFPNVFADDLGRPRRLLVEAGFLHDEIEAVAISNPTGLLWAS